MSDIATAGDSVVRTDFVPKEAYISREFAKREKERLWTKAWQVACREQELARVGDFVTYDICDQSIVVVRAAPDQIRAFYNVCLHRGRRLAAGCGHAARFHCNFHGWRWKLDGTLDRILDRSDWDGCPSVSDDDFRLREVKVDTWGGFVFVNFDPGAEPLADYLDPVPSFCDCFELERMRIRWSKSVRIPCNWKVALEAFNEGYHVAATHPQLLADFGDDRTRSHTHGKHGMFGYYHKHERPFGAPSPRLAKPVPDDLRPGMIAYTNLIDKTLHAIVTERDAAAASRLMSEASADMDPIELVVKMRDFQREAAVAAGAGWPEVSLEDQGKAGTDWHVFPNLIFLPAPGGTLAYRSRPWGDGEDPDWCVYDIWSLERYAPGAEPDVQHDQLYGEDDWRAIGEVSIILKQDFDNMAEIQRGMKIDGFPGSRTSPLQESVISNTHRVLHEYLASE